MNSAVYRTSYGLFSVTCDGDVLIEIRRVYNEDLPSEPSPATDRVFAQLQEYFAGRRKVFELEYQIDGTPFRRRVLQALSEVPYGETCSYRDLAAAAGYPKAQRAVGNIMHTNKLMLVLPCHRIIKSDGKLGGYAGDEDLKLALLEIEQNYK